MLTIMVLGLDHYVTGDFSKKATRDLSQILRIPETDILFFGAEGGLYFQGVEQTSWQGVIIVTLPETLKSKESDIATYLLTQTTDALLNLSVEFHYFKSGSYYERVNEDYPRFLSEEDERVTSDDEEDDEHHDHDHEDDEDENANPNEEEVYHGNAFVDFEKRAKEAGHHLDDE